MTALTLISACTLDRSCTLVGPASSDDSYSRDSAIGLLALKAVLAAAFLLMTLLASFLPLSFRSLPNFTVRCPLSALLYRCHGTTLLASFRPLSFRSLPNFTVCCPSLRCPLSALLTLSPSLHTFTVRRPFSALLSLSSHSLHSFTVRRPLSVLLEACRF